MNSKVAKNTFMLYIMSIAKLIFPLLTMPYLTRVLSPESYGFVSYVKSCMTYMQLVVDFGFILSSVKDIVKADGDKKKIGQITGNTFASKIMLCVISALILFVMCIFIDLLQLNILYVILSFVAVASTSFLADFLFRGIEKMHYITIIYLISKGVSVVLTFIMVKGDGNILWVPILDILTNLISILLTIFIVRRLGIRICTTGLLDCFKMIKESFVYFLSSIATTAFSALNTLLIGIFIKDLTLIAYWSMCLSITSAIQGLYSPITNGVYPHMVKEKKLGFIHRVLLIFMPIVVLGCIVCLIFAELAMYIVGGEQYIEAANLFRLFVPVLFFSFPAQLYGWPTLGAIGCVKETTSSTIVAATMQVVGLLILAVIDQFNLVALALLRAGTEACLMLTRMFITYRNKGKFAIDKKIVVTKDETN